MQFTIVSILVPIVLFFSLPRVLGSKKYTSLLCVACVLFAVSWYVPSPDIYGMQTSFMTHFFGGGVFCGLLGLYLKLVKSWQKKWYIELVALLAFVSSLGVLNELFEVLLWTVDLMPQGLADTSWDLVANTAGALTCFGGYKVVQWLRSAWTK